MSTPSVHNFDLSALCDALEFCAFRLTLLFFFLFGLYKLVKCELHK